MSRRAALPRALAGACATLGAVLQLALAAPAAEAQVVRAFTPRYTTSDRGDITLIGNTVMTCSGGGTCTNGRQGNGNRLNNNDHTMVYVNVDTDPATFSSSNAQLSLPAGATVLWAGLYWSGTSNNAARNTVRFATPAAGYATVTATQLDASGTVYKGFRDVTALVQAGGNGTYWVADVRSTPNSSNVFAGWSLVVAYRLASDPPRNLVVFDGHALIQGNTTLNLAVSGFVTPLAGAVNTRIGVVASEGDLGYTGDQLRLNGVALSDAVNPSTNFFNSSITRLGARVTTKNPDYVNQYGWDVDLVSANGQLPNGATSATITLVTNGDTYYPGVVTFATDLYEPVIVGGSNFTKTVTDLNGAPVRPGDVLEYLVTMNNSGNDAAAGTVLRDTLPANAVYVPGSLAIVTGPNSGAKTDGAGDDQAEYEALLNRVVVRLGNGASAAAGGTLNPAASTSVRFRVTVGASVPNGAVVSNQGWLSYTGQTTGFPYNGSSDGDPVVPGIQRTDVTVVVPPSGVAVSGTVYEDLDHDALRDVGESGTGTTLWAKLVLESSPAVAQQAAVVTPATGGYSFAGVLAGTYTVLIDDNATLADVTAALPAGWIGTEAAGGARSGVVVGAAAVSGLDFGLWHGSRLDGRVFRDDGAGGGAANDGARQGSEAGIAGVRVRAWSAACAGGVCDSALTDGAGAYRLWLPSAAAGGTVTVSETNPAGWLSTGAAPGTTGAVYVRAADEASFTMASGVLYSGPDFGDVPPNAWAAGGAQTIVPGAFALYRHTFTAGSAGSLTLAAAATPIPALPGWSATLYHDLDCDGAIDAGEPAILAPLALTAGQSVCVLARHQSPAGAPDGAAEQLALTAAFDYTGAAPPLATATALTDLTTLAAAGGLQLVKSASAANARPGDVITYTLAYTNPGPDPLSAIVISDATPSWTVFVGASCATLGAGLTSCTLTIQPAAGAVGAVQWTLSGTLAPGGSGTVSYQVRVE